MPNKRGKNQTLLAFSLDVGLLESIDVNRGPKSRSQFIREAIFEKLVAMGSSVDPSIVHPPDRVRKQSRRSMVVKARGDIHSVIQHVTFKSGAAGRDASGARSVPSKQSKSGSSVRRARRRKSSPP